MGFGSPESTTNALSGGVAGAANIFTGFPFDTVKVRLQASPRGTYAGPIDCTRSILKFEGVRGMPTALSAATSILQAHANHMQLTLVMTHVCRYEGCIEALQPLWLAEP